MNASCSFDKTKEQNLSLLPYSVTVQKLDCKEKQQGKFQDRRLVARARYFLTVITSSIDKPIDAHSFELKHQGIMYKQESGGKKIVRFSEDYLVEQASGSVRLFATGIQKRAFLGEFSDGVVVDLKFDNRDKQWIYEELKMSSVHAVDAYAYIEDKKNSCLFLDVFDQIRNELDKRVSKQDLGSIDYTEGSYQYECQDGEVIPTFLKRAYILSETIPQLNMLDEMNQYRVSFSDETTLKLSFNKQDQKWDYRLFMPVE